MARLFPKAVSAIVCRRGTLWGRQSWRTGRTAGLPRHTAPFNESRMRTSAKGMVHSGTDECSPATAVSAQWPQHSCKIRLCCGTTRGTVHRVLTQSSIRAAVLSYRRCQVVQISSRAHWRPAAASVSDTCDAAVAQHAINQYLWASEYSQQRLLSARIGIAVRHCRYVRDR